MNLKSLDRDIVDAAVNGKEPEVGDVVLYIGTKERLEGFWEIDDDCEDDGLTCVRFDSTHMSFEVIPEKDLSRAIPEHLLKRIDIAVKNDSHQCK